MALTKVKPSNVDDQVIGRKNIIINGDMKVYQRAQSITGFTSAYTYYTADRMRFSSEGGTVGTWNQEVQTDQNIGDYSNVNVLKTTCTSAGADFKRGVNYRIEPIDIKHMIGKTCTLSFYAKADATVTQQRAIAFISGGSLASSVDMGDITLTTTWTKYTATFTMANCTDYADMLLRVDGDTETSSYITLIQLELGSQATPFEFRNYGEQLELCKRYYQLNTPNVGRSNSTTSVRCSVTGTTEMRATPTASVKDGTNKIEQYAVATRNLTAIINTSGYGTLGGLSDVTVTTTTSGVPHALYGGAIALDAEL